MLERCFAGADRPEIVAALTRRTLLLMTAVLALLVVPSTASALVVDQDYYKQPQVKEVTTEVLKRLSPQEPTAEMRAEVVAEAEGITAEAVAADSAAAEQVLLQQEVIAIVGEAGLAPTLASEGVLYLAPVAAAAYVGWKIGSGINAKFIQLRLPAPPVDALANGKLVFQEAGSTPTLNGSPLPEDAWVLRWWWSSQSWASVNLMNDYGGYGASLSMPPPGYNILPGIASVPWGVAGAPVASFWLPENALSVSGIKPYTGQSFELSDVAPPEPTPAQLSLNIDAALGNPANALARDWFNYQLGAPGATDPVGDGAPNPDIEFPGSPGKFKKHYDEGEFRDWPSVKDADTYWRTAADIVKRGDDDADDTVIWCWRTEPGGKKSKLYFERATGGLPGRVVFVKFWGDEYGDDAYRYIETFFVPKGPSGKPDELNKTYFDSKCDTYVP